MTRLSTKRDAIAFWSRPSPTTPSTCSSPDGIVTSWNPGAQRFKGYKPAEIIGQHFSRFYTAEDRAAGLPERALATARREGRFEGEGWRVRKDGSRFWAHVVIDPIRRPDGELIGFAKITRDLTERRAAEERAAAERGAVPPAGAGRHRLRDLHARSRRPCHQLELRRRAHQGLSAAKRSSASISRASTPPKTATAGEPQTALGTAAREGRFEKEGWRVRKDGTPFLGHVVIDPIRDDDGELIGFAKITRDITERTETQQAAGEGARGAVPVAEDGGDRPAHRRHRPRLQQSADGDPRQPGDRCKKRLPHDPR